MSSDIFVLPRPLLTHRTLGVFGNFVFGFGFAIEGQLERSLWTSGNETSNYEWVLGQGPNMGLVSFQGFGCFSFL